MNKSISQELYDNVFLNIENNLREMGHGDVTVNKKMKDLNQVFHDILLKFVDEKYSNKIKSWILNVLISLVTCHYLKFHVI